MERLAQFGRQLVGFFAALPVAQRLSFAALVLGVTVATGLLGWWVTRPQYQVLIAGAEGGEAASVVAWLKEERIAYRFGPGGQTIEVPRDDLYEARMALAARGLPRGSGVGFEIFDQQTIGMTDFVQRLGYQRALQGELERTIRELDAVDAARVHLALPERSLFVGEERRPTASVVLRLRAGARLDGSQVQGVVNLVAGSVEGLKAADVTVVDVSGQVLNRPGRAPDEIFPARGLASFRDEVERDYVDRIESMLARVLGAGHAVARVSVELDRAASERTEETYDPDGAVVTSERRSTEKNTRTHGGGAASVEATLTNAPPQAEGSGSEREDAVLSYELSRVTQRTVEAAGGVKRISVAVLLDGMPAAEGEPGEFVPRPAEEIERYRLLVMRAVGFDESRGDLIEVTSVPFRTFEPQTLAEPDMLTRVSAHADTIWRGAGLAVLVLVLLAVVRPFLLGMAARAPLLPVIGTSPQLNLEDDGETAAALPPPGRVAEGLTEIARQNPEQTANVIRQWVGGGDG